MAREEIIRRVRTSLPVTQYISKRDLVGLRVALAHVAWWCGLANRIPGNDRGQEILPTGLGGMFELADEHERGWNALAARICTYLEEMHEEHKWLKKCLEEETEGTERIVRHLQFGSRKGTE